MTAATNPQTVTFGTGPFTFAIPSPIWRWIQIDNQTTANVTVSIQTGSATVIQAVTVATLSQATFGMATALNNPNLNSSNQGSYDNSTGAPGLSGESVFPLDQASMTNWTAQTTAQSGALAGQVVVTGTASSGNVYLSWL